MSVKLGSHPEHWGHVLTYSRSLSGSRFHLLRGFETEFSRKTNDSNFIQKTWTRPVHDKLLKLSLSVLTRGTRRPGLAWLGPARPCQNPNSLWDLHTNHENPLLVGADVHFLNSPVLNPGHRLRCTTSCCAKIQAPEQSGAVFLDGATWLQVVRSQNSSPPLLQDPPEKEKASAVREWRNQKNVGESKQKNRN